MKNYDTKSALIVIKDAIDKRKSELWEFILLRHDVFYIKPNILGLKKLGALDYLRNYSEVEIIMGV